jgi:galactokinase
MILLNNMKEAGFRSSMVLKDLLGKIYTAENIESQLTRYSDLLNKFTSTFNSDSYNLFSSPGRTEISGNHTDHNHGKVIAASINLDTIAAAARNMTNTIRLYSEGYAKPFVIDLDNLVPVPEEKNLTHSIIRGVAAGFRKYGFNTGGFDAYVTSDVLIGSGLSSSASIEVLIGTIYSTLFNDCKVSDELIAIIGKYAENVFFAKPCGLMDQLACAVGGIISIDFQDPEKPVIEKIDFDFQGSGYRLLIVASDASHVDLTPDYASIPLEMKMVAAHFNKSYLREVSLSMLLGDIKNLREKAGDRAVLRAIHFLEENTRVDRQVNAIKQNDFKEFLALINESGNSSFKYLQNIYSPRKTEEQGVSLALALSDLFIKEKGRGACRVHGGGFAGTIQVFLPEDLVNEYSVFMSQVFNSDSVKVLSVRDTGSVCLDCL